MALNWEFPTINKTELVREFNGEADRLEDFKTSVETFFYSRDIPVQNGGYVKPDGEGGYDYIENPADMPQTAQAVVAANLRPNYKYASKVMPLIAERLTGSARDWWITTGSKGTLPNCWRPAPVGCCPPGIIERPLWYMFKNQFQNSRTQDNALLALETLKWDSAAETVSAFRTCITALFSKAGITEFNGQRPYILKVLSENLCRLIQRPANSQDLWFKLEEAIATEESIRADRAATKDKLAFTSSKSLLSKGEKRDSERRDMKDITCYTCNQKGHISPNCPQNKDKKSDGKQGRKKKDPPERSEDDICYTCGGKGHCSPECPSKKTLAKKTGSDKTEITSSKLHMDTRQPAQELYYQQQASPSWVRTPTPQQSRSQQSRYPQDELGTFYYHFDTKDGTDFIDTTECYAFETLPWFDKDEEMDNHWKQEEAMLHSYSQFHYDYSKYGQDPPPVSDTEFYSAETELQQLHHSVPVPPPEPESDISAADVSEAISNIQSGPIVPPPCGSMRTFTHTVDDNKRMLTVLDTGTAPNLIPRSSLIGCGYKIDRPTDLHFVSTDTLTTTPIGVCDKFMFNLGDVCYTTKVYVCEKVAFQLLLGNYFLWSIGAVLFPRMGKVMITRPALRVIAATCELLTANQHPPPLERQPSQPPPKATPLIKYDPDSGEELLEHPPLDFHYLHVKPIESTIFLKITPQKDVITIGEKDYVTKTDGEEGEGDTEIPTDDLKMPPDVITDTFVKERFDINPEVPQSFKDKIIEIGMKYHKAISWTEDDLGKVTDVPYRIILKEGTIPVRQPTRRYLYNSKNEAIIRKKTTSYIRLGVWRKCKFSPWLTQLVIAKKNRVCHDFTSLNKATVLDAFPIHSIPDIVAAQAGMGTWTIMDTDRRYLQIIMAILCIFLTAFEMFYEIWESTRMLFGMTGSPSTFYRNMTVMMEPVLALWSEFVHWFFDDIIIGTKADDWDKHVKIVECVMKAARDRGWKFGAHEMHFGYSKLRILGIIITPHGHRPDPEKVDTLLSMCIPRHLPELKSFLRPHAVVYGAYSRLLLEDGSPP